jgi:hypothetical protein
MVVYFIVIIAVALVIDYFVAKAFQDIATMKGHSETKYFWYSFFLGFIGYLMVVALPTNTTVYVEAPKKAGTPVNDELPEI